MSTLYSIYAFIFGCLIGSFLNVVILRLPAQKNLANERSVCPKCGNQLRWFHNIPVLSFIFLRGKCAFCGTRISWRYPLIEILTGLISYWLFPETTDLVSLGHYIFFFTIACVFICHFFIDLDHQLLLDSLNLYLLVPILGYVAFTFPWQHWVMGGGIGFGVPLFVTWLFYKLRGQIGLGGGDIKLFGILGFYLGPVGIILNIFLSCTVGAIVGIALMAFLKHSKDKPMPFGPAILLVSSFQIFFPQLAQQLQNFLFF
jgi:prepilin signal peptidase PulO-like enzyme (type II secretory pathway)